MEASTNTLQPMKKKEYTPPKIESFVVSIHPVLSDAAAAPYANQRAATSGEERALSRGNTSQVHADHYNIIV